MEEGDKIRFAFSYVGEESLLIKVGTENFVRECDFSSKAEIRKFRIESQPWIDAGMIYRRWDAREEQFHYSLTEDGREVYNYLKPTHKQS
jgi:hypothetical protein